MAGSGYCLTNDLIDVLDARGNHLGLLLGGVDPVRDVLVDLLVLQLLESELQDLTLSEFAVMDETEEGDTVVVLHRELGLVRVRIVQAVVQERLDHAYETVEVDVEFVLHLQPHVILMRNGALVKQLYVSLGGQLEADSPRT